MWQFEKPNVPPKLFFLTLFWEFLTAASYRHHSTNLQLNKTFPASKIRLLGQKRMFYLKTSVFDLEVLFLRPERFCLAVD
jgi:hypothetical protein